jgi:hypothetical protein
MRSTPAIGILAGMHPHIHMQLARAIIDERIRDAAERNRTGQTRQLDDRPPRRLPHTVTRGHSRSVAGHE